MIILAVDHGTVHIGLAICDINGIVARPLPEHLHVSRDRDAAAIASAATEYGARAILLGTTTDSTGDGLLENRTIRHFAAALSNHTDLPVKYWDESDSSVRAAILSTRSNARPKAATVSTHSMAAAVILQDYLDAHARNSEPPQET